MVGPSEVNEEVLSFRNLNTMREALGFTSMDEMKDFVSNSPNFSPHFTEYANLCIFPQQEEALRLGSVRTKGPTLPTVERRLIAGETAGDNKFSTQYPDKTNWDHVDHCAYMLFGLREANKRSARGLFYRKNLDLNTVHNRLWSLLKWWEYEHSPSRMKKDPKGKIAKTPQSKTPLSKTSATSKTPLDKASANPKTSLPKTSTAPKSNPISCKCRRFWEGFHS